MTKYFFIGDIHGCADELRELLYKINPSKNDIIISVGDIVNKGPKSEEAVQLLMKYNVKSVMGNHDSLIKMIFDFKEKNIKAPKLLKPEHFNLYDSLSESSINYIVNLPNYIRLSEINTLVIHAGLAPYKSLKEQSEEELTCIRIVDPITKTFVKRGHTGIPWHFYYEESERIIYGHNAAKSIKYKKNTIGIDTGCLYGEKLTAYILPDDKFISVKAKKTYNDYTQNGKFKMPL